MSPRWSEMEEDERTELRLHLALDLASDELASAPEPADTARRPRFDEIHAAALNPAEAMDESLTAALTGDIEARATFETLVREAALCWFPAAAAAADGEGTRYARGRRVFDSDSPVERRGRSGLRVDPLRGRPRRQTLGAGRVSGQRRPRARGAARRHRRVYQLVEHRDSPLVRAIRDPASRLALA